MTRERITTPRPGTVERTVPASEVTARWWAANCVVVVRDLQDQLDRLRGTPEPTLTRERLTQLDAILERMPR